MAQLRTELLPRELLGVLQGIEARLGRTRSVHWGPRTIDLDLLAYDEDVVFEPDLWIPHPRMAHRIFVLAPMAELAPQWRHPLLRASTLELLELARRRVPGPQVRGVDRQPGPGR